MLAGMQVKVEHMVSGNKRGRIVCDQLCHFKASYEDLVMNLTYEPVEILLLAPQILGKPYVIIIRYYGILDVDKSLNNPTVLHALIGLNPNEFTVLA